MPRPAEAARRNGWQPRPIPPEYADLDTRFFRSDRTGRPAGGLFGLDRVHPTTSGYAVLADALRDVLITAGVAARPLDHAALRRADTLNTTPPALLGDALQRVTPFPSRLMSG